jgi:hypothetical protein
MSAVTEIAVSAIAYIRDEALESEYKNNPEKVKALIETQLHDFPSAFADGDVDAATDEVIKFLDLCYK